MSYVATLLVLFLLANAIFWGLYPHATHCKVASVFTSAKCPSHIVHIIIGVLSFVAAVAVAQRNYLFPRKK